MAPFEYLLAFAVVVLGLAIAELAMGLSKLLRAEAVRWDWLAPLAALLVFVKIVAQWWGWHAAGKMAAAMTFEIFMAVLASAAILFLLAATPFPEPREEGTDLRAHYERVRKRFWILFALHSAASIGVAIWVQMAALNAQLVFSVIYLVPLAALGFAFARWRWVQAIGLVGFTLLYAVSYFGRTLF